MASRKGHTATVQVLLEAGADKEANDEVKEWEKEWDINKHMRGWKIAWRRHFGLSLQRWLSLYVPWGGAGAYSHFYFIFFAVRKP